MALGNAPGRGTITVTAGQVTALKQTITVSNEGGSTASGTLDGMIQANADVVPGDSGSSLLGMSTSTVCTLRLRARSPVASSSARARLAKPSMSPACPTPVKQRRLADARFLRSTSIALSSLRAAASTPRRERSRTGWPAYGVHVNPAVSFSVLPAIAHVSVRVALAAPNSACRPAGRARTSPVGTFCPPGRR